ncbi:MAG: GNAT family N-acetyltransferase [Candidatus Omnitrophota bacterium]|nr:GNAT family N-acetyltransferase [Candidatus Omnitrophota bacterium]
MDTQIDTLITTSRLSLRPVTMDDVGPVYLQALNDPEVVGLTEARHVRWDRQAVLDYVAQSNREGVSQLLGIFLKDSDQHIGNVRLFNFSSVHRRLELSIIIFDKSQWSKGYGAEVLQGVSRYVFEVLQFTRICADYYAPNAASARMFEKVGFQIEGVFKQHFLLDSQYVDSVRVAKINPAIAPRPSAVGGMVVQHPMGGRDVAPIGAEFPVPRALPVGLHGSTEPPPSCRADGGGRPAPIPSNGPSITEREVALVTEAVRDGWYAKMSRYLEAFERRFAEHTGMRYCLATSSGTGALHLAMLGLRLGPGDEVIVPDITWVASAAAICYVGATPVFVDVDRTTWCLSAEAFERAITRRTKAVVVVDLLGNFPDMDAVRTIARQRGIHIIEDAAQAIGAEYRDRKAGSFGEVGIFSFTGTKLMVTGEGGMLVTNEKTLYQRAKGLAHHGLLMRGARSKMFWAYELGYKYKMTNLQAALGIAQLERIDELIERRRQLFRWYQARLRDLDGVQLNREGAGVRSTFWIPTAIVSRRYGLTKEAIVRKLAQRNIAARPLYYPLSAMPPFAPYCRGKRMARINPVTYAIAPYGICLPSAFVLTEADVDYVCTQLRDILTGRGRR